MPAMLRAPRLCFTRAVALEKTAGGGGDNHTGVLKRGKKKKKSQVIQEPKKGAL